MKTLFASLLLIFISLDAVAQVTPSWVRYPSISPNGKDIAFTYKGDLYRVPSSGGEAARLTFHVAHDYKPVWSKDGKSIAFASDRFGNFDIFVMPAMGGTATRLTFHSTDEEPYTFNNNNQAVFFKAQRMDTNSHRQHPTTRQAELYSVPVTGGRVSQILTVPAEDVQISSNGKQLIYHDNKGTENPWRKHHQSSITRDIWTYNMNSKKHQRLTEFYGEDRNPVYNENESSIYYLSEESGSFNVHSMRLNRPSSNKQLTNFSLHPVRFLSIGANTLAFGYHGEVYTITENGEAKKVPITIRTQDNANAIAVEAVDGEISEMAISKDGKEIAYVAHGEVFVSAIDGAFTKQITHTAAQEAFVSFDPEGKYVMYAGERAGKWSIYKTSKARPAEPFFYAATTLNEVAVIDNDKDNYLPKLSPNGNKLAFIEDRKTLKVMDLETQKTRTLITADKMIHMSDGDQQFSWSPDSEWILFEYNKRLNNADIAIVNASGNEQMKVIVPSGYYDSQPTWANNGKQILWMSNRDGLKSYATSGRTENDVYSMFFTQEDWDKFNLSEDDFALLKAIEEAEKGKANKDDAEADDAAEDEDAEEEVSVLAIEWDGLEDRSAKLTIHSSSLADAVLNKDTSKLYYLSRFENDFDLWETDLRTQETRKAISLGASDGSLLWNNDMDTLYLLSEGSISKLDPENGAVEAIPIAATVEIDQVAVRLESFEHVWLRTAKIFYEPSFHGVDWNKMRMEYRPKVSQVSNVYEYTELLSEMIGELNVSHAGAGFRTSNNMGDETASLGIFYDYKHTDDGIKITEIIKGGPLDKAKYDIEPGMVIEKIDGQTVLANMDFAKLLNKKAGEFVLLDIRDQGGNTSQITMKPITLGEENQLLYKRYVKINEQEVLEKSNGTLGYVHIPGMADGPYRSIYNDMLGRFFDKKAMVVDTRFNGGGDLVADLAMFFTGEPFLTYAIEGKVVGGEPTSRYTKPVLALFNESMYSDGHCFASGYKDLKLGKSVGMPVPGTCSFAGWESLPLGGYWGVVPISAKNKQGEWLENNETKPDIEVRNEPGVVDFGKDQQLERAIKELLKSVK